MRKKDLLNIFGAGKEKWQGFYDAVQDIALIGLNIGGGGNCNDSGEKYVLEYLKKNLKKENIVVFDVGANVGDYTKMVVDLFKDSACIYAFEPAENTYEKLEKKTADYQNVRCYKFGLGEEKKKAPIFSDSKESGLASLYKRNLRHFNLDMASSEIIQIDTIDNFCKEQGIKEIDFLKLDVEGYELNVLKGASEMLTNIRFIQFEFGGCNIDSRTFFQDFYYLLEKEFYVFRVLRDGLRRISSYKEKYECFRTTNFFAQRKSL